MHEKTVSHVESVPSPLEQLFFYINTLPNNHGIRGQVQISVIGTEVFQESALYEPTMNNGELTFKAANNEGALITYTAKDGSAEIFTDQFGGEHRAYFPGFELKMNE